MWRCRPSALLGLSDDSYSSFCVDESIFAFGTAIESELNSLKQGKSESGESFARRKQSLFLRLLEAPDEVRFAVPSPTK